MGRTVSRLRCALRSPRFAAAGALLRLVPAIALVAVVASGCAFRKPPFANAAETAGGEFAAAAETIQYFHTGKLPRTYAEASFVSYRQALRGLDQTLRAADGAPPPEELEPLLQAIRPAQDAVARPCLDGGCDWAGQVAALRAASEALREAAGAS